MNPSAQIAKSDGTGAGPEVREAAEILDAGKLAAFPTETVFALAAAYRLPQAIARLAALKRRDTSKPFAALVSDVSDVSEYVSDIPPAARKLMEAFWPGPLTIVLPVSRGSRDTVGLRMPDHALARAIVRAAHHGVAATSANISGKSEAICADQVAARFGDKLDLIIDDGTTPSGRPSTVVKVTWAGWEVLREGQITAQEIRKQITDNR